MAIIAKFTRTLPAPTATISGGFVFLLSAGWFTQANTGAAGSPIDGGINSIANGGGDMQIFSDTGTTIRLPIEVVTFVTGGSPQAQVRVFKSTYQSGDTITIGKDDTQTTQPAVGAAFGRNATWINKKRSNNLYNASLIDSAGDSDLTVNTGSLSTVTGPFGFPVADFDGSVNLTSPSAVVLGTNAMSMSVWLLRDSTTEAAPFGTTIKASDETDFGTRYDITGFVTGNANCWKSSIKDATQESSASSSLNNTWQLMHLVRDGTTARLYLDGVEDVNWAISSTNLNANNIYIGIGTKNTSSWRGAICESIIEYSTYTPALIASEYLNQSDPDNFGTSSEYVLVGGSGISIAVDSGTYSQTGTITPINAQLNITTTAGSYLLAGSDVNLTSAKKLITETGSYNLTGTDVTLIYTPGGGGETLIVGSGVYSLAGDEVLLRADLSIIANSDDYSIAGTSTPIRYNASIIADSGSYSLVGTDLNLFANYGMIAISNSYSLTGTSVTLKYSGDTNQVIGTVTAGFAPDLYSAGYKPNTITVTFKE